MLIVYLFVLLDGLGKELLRLGSLGREVGLVSATDLVSERLGLVEFLDADGQVSDGKCHASALIVCFLEERGAELPVGLRLEVLGVVAHHVGELSTIETTQVWAHLVRLEGLVEVESDLGGDLGEHSRVHASVTRLLEEEVLGLGQAEVRVLGQCLLLKVTGGALGR